MSDDDEVTALPSRSIVARDKSSTNSRHSSARGLDRKDSKLKEILVERTVIDEQLIRDAVREELLTQHDPSCVPAARDIDLMEVTTLILSFQNIYQIDNLLGFERLTKLQLDNNIIEKIENLDTLVNLEWLDLSFNNITKIEGLEKLVNLTDLSLFNNQIEKIENLETLPKLNVLSLGRNRVRDLEGIKDLRRFTNLRCLNLKGNPVCDDDQYRNTVFAFVTSLKYLDYQMIEPIQFQKATDAYMEQLDELQQKDKIIAAELREEKHEAERKAVLADANIDGVPSLLTDILADDAEQVRLRLLPGFNKILQEYKTMFEKATSELQQDMLASHQLKKDEIKLFETVRKRVTGDAEKKSIDKIQAFEARKKKEVKRWQASLGGGTPEKSILLQLDEDVNVLYDQLMDYEMLQVEQMDSVLEEFKESYTKYVGENVLKVAVTFKTLQDVAGNYQKTVTDLIKSLHERFSKEDGLDSDKDGNSGISAEAIKMVLSDKDAVIQSIITSHEHHIARIIAKDDDVRERESGLATKLISDARKAEYQRNRHRVNEIFDLTERFHKMILDEASRFSESDDEI